MGAWCRQTKMLEMERERAEAQRLLAEAHEMADTERAALEQQVRRAREDGSLRIQCLEETVKSLSARGELQQVIFFRRSYDEIASFSMTASVMRDHQKPLI